MKPETVSAIQSCFPGAQWAKPTSKQHDASHVALAPYSDEIIVRAVTQAKTVLVRTFITVAELATYCKAESRRSNMIARQMETSINPHEVELERAASLKRVLNMPREEIAGLVKRGREAGVLSRDPIDPDILKWRSWQVGIVCAIADTAG